MRYFCTYFDINYASRGLILYNSLCKFYNNEFRLYVLCLDLKAQQLIESLHDICIEAIALVDMEQQYLSLSTAKQNRSKVEYYFTLTPFLPLYLFKNNPHLDVITYLDSDIYFLSSPEVLFEELGEKSVLLVPHWFSEAEVHQNVYGTYNVSFNSFRNDADGIRCLKWWADSCLEWCFDRVEDNKFADQKYLESFEKLSNKVCVTKNQGANKAVFNIKSGQILKVGPKYTIYGFELVYYHFHQLRNVNSYLFNPYFNDAAIYNDPCVIEIYSAYINHLKTVEKKLKLGKFNQVARYGIGILTPLQIEYKLIHEHHLIYTPFFTKGISLKKIYSYNKRIAVMLARFIMFLSELYE